MEIPLTKEDFLWQEFNPSNVTEYLTFIFVTEMSEDVGLPLDTTAKIENAEQSGFSAGVDHPFFIPDVLFAQGAILSFKSGCAPLLAFNRGCAPLLGRRTACPRPMRLLCQSR